MGSEASRSQFRLSVQRYGLEASGLAGGSSFLRAQALTDTIDMWSSRASSLSWGIPAMGGAMQSGKKRLVLFCKQGNRHVRAAIDCTYKFATMACPAVIARQRTCSLM